MTHTYHITGMTCGSCVAKVKSAFLKLGDITEAEVQLNSPQATLGMQQHVPLATLQDAIGKAGNYTIAPAGGGMQHAAPATQTAGWWQTYKPVLVLFFYLLIVSSVVSFSAGGFNYMLWMRSFMGGFFLAFSFFKMLDLRSFADAYAGYDIIARRIPAYGYVYPFIELLLGIAFISNLNAVWVNGATLVVMGISLVGVMQAVLSRQKIRCACLGSVFNLPMSTITVIEDGLMVLMSAAMLLMAL